MYTQDWLLAFVILGIIFLMIKGCFFERVLLGMVLFFLGTMIFMKIFFINV